MSNRHKFGLVLAAGVIAFVVLRFTVGDLGSLRSSTDLNSTRKARRVFLRHDSPLGEVLPAVLIDLNAPARRIAGIVVGNDDVPVKGARVELAGTYAELVPHGFGRAVTDAGGRFDLGEQPAARHAVVATAVNGMAWVSIDLRDQSPSTSPNEIVLRLATCRGQAFGRIHDLDGRPIVGARVGRGGTAEEVGTRAGIVESDGEGRFEVCGASGRFVISAAGYGTVDVVGPPPRGGFDIVLLPGGVVAGRVVDVDGTSMAGTVVTLWARVPGAGRGGPLARLAMSDSSGRFQFIDVESGDYGISAEAAGFDFPRPWPEVTVAPGTRVDDLVLAPEPCLRWIRGRVKRDDEALGGVIVKIGHVRTKTALDGSFTIPCLGMGELFYEVEGFEVVSGPIPPEDEALEAVVVRVKGQGPAAVVGRVTRDGRPAAGVIVAEGDPAVGQHLLSPLPHTRTRHDGHYRIEGLVEGTHRLAAYDPANRDRAAPQAIDVKGGALVTLDFSLEARAIVSGQLVDLDGRPLPGVKLSFQGAHLPNHAIEIDLGEVVYEESKGGIGATTDSFGRFLIAGLAAGTYAVSVGGGRSDLRPVGGARIWSPITIGSGQRRIEVVLRAGVRSDGAIGGHVVRGGMPVVAKLSLLHGERRLSTTSGRDGRFRFANLVRGTYRLDARGLDGAEGHADATTGDGDVSVVLAEIGSIRGEVVGAVGRRCDIDLETGEGFTGVSARETSTIGARFVFVAVAPGTYDIVAQCADIRGRARAVVSAGQEATVSIAVSAPTH